VHVYIVNQRIDRAARRLPDSDDSVKAIAIDSGYKKQRSFKQYFHGNLQANSATHGRLHQERAQANA